MHFRVKKLPHFFILFFAIEVLATPLSHYSVFKKHIYQTSNKWALSSIHYSDVADKFRASKEVLVAVVDTGIDPQHTFLTKNIYYANRTLNNFGKDFSKAKSVNEQPTDVNGHGTHVSGIIKMIAPKVKLLGLKYYSKDNNGDENLDATIKALQYAVDSNVDIINYSGGGPVPSKKEFDVLKEAEDKGILIVAAAGNESSDIDKPENKYYPASYNLKNIITVASYNRSLQLLRSSNFGKSSVDIAAPGRSILSTLPKNKLGKMTGTSQATAFVTGVAAQIKRLRPEILPEETINIIVKSAAKYPHLKRSIASEGILNMKDALKQAIQ